MCGCDFCKNATTWFVPGCTCPTCEADFPRHPLDRHASVIAGKPYLWIRHRITGLLRLIPLRPAAEEATA